MTGWMSGEGALHQSEKDPFRDKHWITPPFPSKGTSVLRTVTNGDLWRGTPTLRRQSRG